MATKETQKAGLVTASGPSAVLTTSGTSKVLTVNAIGVHQHDRTHYAFALSGRVAQDLFASGVLKVDEWSQSNPDGYQRTPTPTRYRKFAKFIQSETGYSPLSALLFLRNTSQMKAEPTGEDGQCRIEIRLDEKNPLFIPDGQHRLFGLRDAVSADADRMGDYDLPCVLMVAHKGADPRFEEATQFTTINTQQKRVPVDLAQRFLFKQQERMAGAIKRSDKLPLEASNQELVPYAVAVVDALNGDSAGPWHDLIDLPNTGSSNRPISQNSFVESIRPLLKHAGKYGWTVGKVVDTITAFWNSVGELCEEAMEHWNNDGCTDTEHKYYVLRTTSGVFSMNELLEWLVGRVEIAQDPASQAAYTAILEADSQHFQDEFWLGGDVPGGAADKGTSRASFNELRKEIQAELASNM